MSIIYDEKQQLFHLQTRNSSYLMEIEEGGVLAHLYFGEKIDSYHGIRKYPRLERSFSPNVPESKNREISLDTLLQESSSVGNGDFRIPSCQIRLANGNSTVDFRYSSHQIFVGKHEIKGMPQSFVKKSDQAETLKIILEDKNAQVNLELYYTLFKDSSVIARSEKLINKGAEPLFLTKLMSFQIDFPANEFEVMHFEGAWAREQTIMREKIGKGVKLLGSRRGTSSHQENPSFILTSSATTEKSGDVYGFCLVYSGNHETNLEKDQYEQLRVMMGINSFEFDWKLESNEQFQTPEVLMNYTNQGFTDHSLIFHSFMKNHIIRKFPEKERPILINNWEATYFDFTEEKLLHLAEEASHLGIELFVLDDGWFGKRNSDTTSLGDWKVNKQKFPNGLANFSKKISQRGLSFGLWIEPEMVSPESTLYEQHPEWALQVPGKKGVLGRGQYVLDFSQATVRKHIFEQFVAVLDTLDFSYIKWDMNRSLTDVFSTVLPPDKQGTVYHRYVLGLYEFLEMLIKRYPNVLFENCSGGGGRFDAGMLYYMPQTWISDNTDAGARLQIQYGASYFYPINVMGAHVSAIPNHQTGRMISLETRGNVAISGILGYECDLTKLSPEEKETIKKQISFYKQHRKLIQTGTFYRLSNPFIKNEGAWSFVSPDKSECLLFYFRKTAIASGPINILKLSGLDKKAIYETDQGVAYSGEELMTLGFYMEYYLPGDYASKRVYLKRRGE